MLFGAMPTGARVVNVAPDGTLGATKVASDNLGNQEIARKVATLEARAARAEAQAAADREHRYCAESVAERLDARLRAVEAALPQAVRP